MDLSTKYMGLTLKHPLVPSASPLSRTCDNIRELEDAGAAAVVLFSLFEEELTHEEAMVDHYMDFGADSFLEATNYFADLPKYTAGPESYLTLISEAKAAVEIPIIASLNCHHEGRWIEYAQQIEQAGADALELNIYDLPTDPQFSGAVIEQRYLNIVREVKANIGIPLAVKIHPFFSSLPHMAHALSEAGADGLVLFNRFYQPDLDIELFQVAPKLHLSNTHEFLLPLRWTAIISPQVSADIAITTGIHSHMELLKAMMVGARVGMMASELLAHGLPRIKEILFSLEQWMEQHEYESIEQMQGSMSFAHVDKPDEFIRANYLKVLRSFSFDPTGHMPD